MEKDLPVTAPLDPELGPRGATWQRPLSRSRATLLHALGDQSEPTTLAALVRLTGLHENTVREHLDALVRRRLVTRTRAEPRGRGRPPWLFAAALQTSSDSEYAGLASALAGAIATTSHHPRRDAMAAGRAWGARLAADLPTDKADRVDQTEELFDTLGFAPERDDAADQPTLRLTRCPLLEAAHRHPEVVCAVHLGLTEGALAAYGSPYDGVDLEPFAEPGACRLTLAPTPEPDSP